MKLLLSHIADLDGITPIILMNLINEEFEYELFDVHDLDNFIFDNLDTDYFDKYEKVYITDLGVSEKCAKKIINSKYKNKFRLFDHHESRSYLNDYDFAIEKEEIDGFKVCGTTLFFDYLVNEYNNPILKKESVLTFVELVRENDTWQFTEFKEDSMNLSALFDFYGKETYIDIYTEFLKNNDKFYFNKTELIILKSLNREKDEYLKLMEEKTIFRNIKGYNIGIVFAEKYRSKLGNHLAHIYKDKVDFICIINLARHISLRGIKENKPVNKFAELYDGGGHPLAAAMPFKEEIKEKIIDIIFGE